MSKLSLPKKAAPARLEQDTNVAISKEPTRARNPCKEFLEAFLAGGPIMRTYVYRESENQNLAWEDVKQAFLEINGREYVQRGEYFWRLMPE